MKTVRLTLLVILLISSFMVTSKPIHNDQVIAKAQQKLFYDFKRNLIVWNALEEVGSDKLVEFEVYCLVDADLEVHIMEISGDNDIIKKKIIDIVELHPVKASKVLKNTNVAFKLRFERF